MSSPTPSERDKELRLRIRRAVAMTRRDEGGGAKPEGKGGAKRGRSGGPAGGGQPGPGRGDAGGAGRGVASRGVASRRPPLRVMTSTLWEYPSQHYNDSMGRTMQGDKGYVGATPSWVIWQLLQRYTEAGEVVLDPMCGSGTTLDVASDLKRVGVGYDLVPSRADIVQADARELPADDESVDFVFIDPPYSTHIDYSDHPDCIGKLDAGEPGGEDEPTGLAYFEAMERVFAEAERVLKPDRCMAVYVSDSWRKAGGSSGRDAQASRVPRGVFMPIGFELFGILRAYFEPVDLISVVRQNAKLGKGNWHQAAERENFFLRGFNHLMIMHKPA